MGAKLTNETTNSMKEPTEQEKETYLDKLKAKIEAELPNPELSLEFGNMLMRHIDSFTPEERERYEELKEILSKTGDWWIT